MSKKTKKPTPKQTVAVSPLVFIIGALVVIVLAGGVFLLTRPTDTPTAVAVAPESSAALPAEISVADAVTYRDQGAFILDVREPWEWAEYHMPGATLIPLGELEARLAELPKDREIVVVCRSGNRSQTGRDTLLKAGFSQVTSMAGGMSAWRAQGLQTVSGQ